MSHRFNKIGDILEGKRLKHKEYDHDEMFGSARISDDLIQITGHEGKKGVLDLNIQILAEAINILDRRVKELENK